MGAGMSRGRLAPRWSGVVSRVHRSHTGEASVGEQPRPHLAHQSRRPAIAPRAIPCHARGRLCSCAIRAFTGHPTKGGPSLRVLTGAGVRIIHENGGNTLPRQSRTARCRQCPGQSPQGRAFPTDRAHTSSVSFHETGPTTPTLVGDRRASTSCRRRIRFLQDGRPDRGDPQETRGHRSGFVEPNQPLGTIPKSARPLPPPCVPDDPTLGLPANAP